MIVYIPMATGQSISHEVLISLMNQTIETDIRIFHSPGEKNSTRYYNELRIKGEEQSRTKCKEDCLMIWNEYVVMQDRDVVHLEKDNLLRMKMKLEKNDRLGAVCLYRDHRPDKNHIIIGCTMFRSKALRAITFKNKYGMCLCKEVQEELNKNGYAIEYLDENIRYKEFEYGTV